MQVGVTDCAKKFLIILKALFLFYKVIMMYSVKL